MRGFFLGAALAATTLSVNAKAANLEVLHWWTAGSEQKSVSVFAEAFNKTGNRWIDTAVATSQAARATTMQRILGGDPPAAALFNTSRQFEELVEAGLLLDLTDVATQQDWDKAVRPKSILDLCRKNGRVYCAPINIHSQQWMWTNKSIFKKVGVEEPVTWQDFLKVAPKIREAGFIPLAWGGQTWQESIVFDAVLLGVGGRDLFYRIYRDRDMGAVNSSEMAEVVRTFAALRPFIDPGSPGRNWNDTTNLLITGKAAAQVMGDWVRGELTLAGLQADVDYGCIPGPSKQPVLTPGGNVFVFPKQGDADVERAQLALAGLVLQPNIQLEFNSAKGSLPVRADVDMAQADACTKKGLQLLQNSDQVVEPRTFFITSDVDGQIVDLVGQFWSSNSDDITAFQSSFSNIISRAN